MHLNSELKLPQNFALFTLAEGVVADPKLIADMTADPAQFVATVDGREENITFSLPKELRIQVIQA